MQKSSTRGGGRRYKIPPTIATMRQYTLNLCLSAYNIDSIYILFYHFLGAAAVAAATCVLCFTLLCSSIYIHRAHMKLTIKNLQYADFGNYRCISKNSLGETEGSIRVYGTCCAMLSICVLYYLPLCIYLYILQASYLLFILFLCLTYSFLYA